MRTLLYPASLFIILTIATLSCGGGSGAGPTPTPSSTATSTPTFLTYTNESQGFSIMYPSDWIVYEEACESCHGPFILFEAPQTCGNFTTHFEVRMDDLPYNMSVSNFFETKLQEVLQNDVSEYAPLSYEELLIDNKNAIKHKFTGVYGQNDVRIAAIGIVDGTSGWYAFCISNESCHIECEDVFDTMAGSFRLIDSESSPDNG